MLIESINYRFTKDSFGIYRHLKPFNNKELENKIKEYIQTIHYTGIFEIEFIIDKQGKYYFLETNFRITQYNSAYTEFGVNFPYLYAKSTLANRLTLEDINFSTKHPFNVMSEFEDFRISVLGKQISLWQWLKNIKQTDAFLFYNKKDKAPFYYTIWEKIKNAF